MDSAQYKKLINNANIFDFKTLTITIAELEKNGEVKIADKIRRILSENKIEKPKYHNEEDDLKSTYYTVDLQFEEIDVIAAIFGNLEIFNLGSNYETTSAASLYASIFDKWNSLLDY